MAVLACAASGDVGSTAMTCVIAFSAAVLVALVHGDRAQLVERLAPGRVGVGGLLYSATASSVWFFAALDLGRGCRTRRGSSRGVGGGRVERLLGGLRVALSRFVMAMPICASALAGSAFSRSL